MQSMIDDERVRAYANRTDELDCVSVDANQMARQILFLKRQLRFIADGVKEKLSERMIGADAGYREGWKDALENVESIIHDSHFEAVA